MTAKKGKGNEKKSLVSARNSGRSGTEGFGEKRKKEQKCLENSKRIKAGKGKSGL